MNSECADKTYRSYLTVQISCCLTPVRTSIYLKQLCSIFIPLTFCVLPTLVAAGETMIETFVRSYNEGPLTSADRWKGWLVKGLAFENRGDLQAARKAYGAALHGAGKKHEEAYLLRGDVNYRLGRYDEALGDFDVAISLNPTVVDAYYLRGSAHYQLHNYDKVIKDYTTFIRVNPKSHTFFRIRPKEYLDFAHVFRGLSHYMLGRCLGAKQDFDSALDINPDIADADFGRGVAQYCLQNYEEAAADFANALDKPEPPDQYAAIWQYLTEVKFKDDAYDRFHKSVKSLDLSKWPGPVVDMFLNKLSPEILLQPDVGANAKPKEKLDCEKHFYVGQYYLLIKDPERAAEYFRKAMNTKAQRCIEDHAAGIELKKL